MHDEDVKIMNIKYKKKLLIYNLHLKLLIKTIDQFVFLRKKRFAEKRFAEKRFAEKRVSRKKELIIEKMNRKKYFFR